MLVVMVSLLCLCFSDGETKEDPFIELLRRFQDRLRQSGAYAYSIELEGTGALAGAFPVTRARVALVLDPKNPDGFSKLRISGTTVGGGLKTPVEIAVLEEDVFKLEPERSLRLHAPVWRNGLALVDERFLVPLLLVPDLLKAAGENIVPLGEELRDGRTLARVRIALGSTIYTLLLDGDAIWLCELTLQNPEEWGDGMLTVRLRNPELGPNLSDTNFSLPLPDGYRDQEFTGELPELGKPAPPFSLEAFDGGEVRPDELIGRVVVLDFWATWCAPCLEAMPNLQRLHERFQGRGLTVIGVNWRERGDPRKFLKRTGYDYRFAFANEPLIQALNPNLASAYVIDRQGRLVEVFMGYFGEESDRRLEELVLKLL